jgi:hypothetical protein
MAKLKAAAVSNVSNENGPLATIVSNVSNENGPLLTEKTGLEILEALKAIALALKVELPKTPAVANESFPRGGFGGGTPVSVLSSPEVDESDKRADTDNRTDKRARKKEEGVETTVMEIPAALSTEEFRAALGDYIEYRKEKGKTFKPLGLKAFLTRWEKVGPARATAAIRYSMANGWDGVFEEHERQGNKKPIRPEDKAMFSPPSDVIVETKDFFGDGV